jgi:hypothetical protein
MTLNENWKTFWDKLAETNDELNRYLSSSLPTAATKNIKKFIDKFEKMKSAAEKVDDFISAPIEPIKIEMPFDSKTFEGEWRYWKDYRLESFNRTYKSREENKVLEYLADISKNNEKEAIEILDFAMAGGYPRFFKIDERINKTNKNENDTDSDFE